MFWGGGGNEFGHLTGIRGLPACFSLSNCLTTLTLFTPLVPPRLEPLEAAVGGLLPVTPNAISAKSLIQKGYKKPSCMGIQGNKSPLTNRNGASTK